MNENPQLEPLDTEADFQKKNLTLERKLSDRILAWAFGGSVLVNIAWIVLVSHSSLFGKSVIPPMQEKEIKVFKRPPPPPKHKPKPPPPPPIHHPPPPTKPLPHITHQKPPPPQVHQVQAHTTNNAHTTSHLSAPPAPPPPPGPFVPTSGPSSPPAPPTPPTPPAPPSPPAAPPPAPPAPPPPPPPLPKPPPPPPPPPRPRNYSPIETQAATYPDVSGDVSLDGIDPSTITPGTVVISFVISETGRVRDAHITKSCGNSEIDNRFLEAVKRTRGTPAIQEHIPHDESQSESFPVGSG